jgi:hypothetical protein
MHQRRRVKKRFCYSIRGPVTTATALVLKLTTRDYVCDRRHRQQNPDAFSLRVRFAVIQQFHLMKLAAHRSHHELHPMTKVSLPKAGSTVGMAVRSRGCTRLFGSAVFCQRAKEVFLISI